VPKLSADDNFLFCFISRRDVAASFRVGTVERAVGFLRPSPRIIVMGTGDRAVNPPTCSPDTTFANTARSANDRTHSLILDQALDRGVLIFLAYIYDTQCV